LNEHHVADSSDLAQVLTEASDIAQAVSQPLTSAHLLLAMFTVENRAQLILKERGIDEDLLLQVMTAAPQEPGQVISELKLRARDIAQSCGSPETDCLHILIAATRVRCLAQDLLLKTGLDLNGLRNTALSYYSKTEPLHPKQDRRRQKRRLWAPHRQKSCPTPPNQNQSLRYRSPRRRHPWLRHRQCRGPTRGPIAGLWTQKSFHF
jgi:ATP-dependent Clp protease ATP-binding subunit ClpC